MLRHSYFDKRIVSFLLMVFLVLFAFGALAENAPAMTLSKEEVSVDKGKTVTLSPKVENVQNAKKLTYTWESSDPAIATVKKGKVQGVDAGTAVITCSATLSDGTVLVAKAKVHVNVKITSLTVTTSKKVTLEGGMTDRVEVEWKPENATNTELVWTSSNPSVVTVEDGYLIGISEGKATITAKAADGSGKKAQVTVQVKGPASSANMYVKITKTSYKKGIYKITFKNMTDRVISEIYTIFIPYTKKGEQIFLNNNPCGEDRHCVSLGLQLAPGKEVTKSFNCSAYTDKKLSYMEFAIHTIVFEDNPSACVWIPNNSMYWYSGKQKGYLGSPAFTTGCIPDPEVIRKSREAHPGYTAESVLLNRFEAEHYGFTSDGVYVLEVAPDSVAARAGLMPGDLIVGADGWYVANDYYALDKAWVALYEGRNVLVEVERAGAGIDELTFVPEQAGT